MNHCCVLTFSTTCRTLNTHSFIDWVQIKTTYASINIRWRGGLRSHKTCVAPPCFYLSEVRSIKPLLTLCIFFQILIYRFVSGLVWSPIRWPSIHFCLEPIWTQPPGIWFSCCNEGPLSALFSCLILSRVVSLAQFPFSFSIPWIIL